MFSKINKFALVALILSLSVVSLDAAVIDPLLQTKLGTVSGDLIPAVTRRAPAASEDQIASPSQEGLIIIRAPLKGLASKGEAEAALARAKCTLGANS